jgi:hypothetical protein
VVGTQSVQGGSAPDVTCLPVVGPGDGVPAAGSDRKVRSGASRLGRRLLLGGLFLVGWVVGVFLLGWVGATPAAADTLDSGDSRIAVFASAELDQVRPVGAIDASTEAEAMAGRGIHGLTFQYVPGRTAPSTIDHTVGAYALAPRSGGGGFGPLGPPLGDAVRSLDDPRLMVLPAPAAGALPPVVRTAADEPSFSPD